MDSDAKGTQEPEKRPKRHRHDVSRALFGFEQADTPLELTDILKILRKYDECSQGGMNCWVCGKLYKSKVCYTKHLWEHSSYWETFSGTKNHERVLSIQAAIILWSGNQEKTNATSGKNVSTTAEKDREDLLSLLVTSPHKKEVNGADEKLPLNPLEPNIISESQRTPVKATNKSTSKKSSCKNKAKRQLMTSPYPVPAPGTDMASPAKTMRQC